MALRTTLFLSLILLTISLIACGTETEPAATPDVVATTNIAQQPEVETSGAAETTEALEPVEESAGVEPESSSDRGAEIVLAQATQPVATAKPVNWQFEQGRHFSILTTSQGTSSSPDVIEVAEIFWYGCSHCYSFDPILENWRTDLPDDVNFVRIPVMWNPTNEVHARMFYTAEALGKLDEMHTAIFQEMHLNGNPLTDQGDIENLFARYDVSSDQFNQTFRSFAVESKLKRARNLTQRYRVRGVPLLVVNGKYTVDGPEIKSLENELAVAKELVKRERLRQ